MRASLGTDLAMFVHLRVTAALRRAGAAKRYAGCQLRFEELTVADLVRTRHDARSCGANRSAILIETDAGYEPLYVLRGKTSVRTCGAGFDASGACGNAMADRVDMAGLLRMNTEHRADGDCGHAGFSSVLADPIKPAKTPKVPNGTLVPTLGWR